MIVRDNPASKSAQGLTNYMSKRGHELKGSHGHEMTDEEIERFHDRTEEEGFTRHLMLGPERSDLSDEELDRATRRSLNEWYQEEDMQDMEYVYSIHNDEGNSHVHVACTASKESGDLWVDSTQDESKIDRLRDDIAADHFRDHTLDQQQEQMLDQGREDELRQEQAERDLGQSPDRGGGLQLAAEAATPDLDEADPFNIDEETEQQFEQEQSRDRSRRR